MTLYYQSLDARITHNVFESRRPIKQSFEIAELHYVHSVADRRRLQATRAGTCSTGLAGAITAVTSAVWPDVHRPLVIVSAFGIVALSSATAGACWMARRRRFELRAVYRGYLVCLFDTADRRTFDQVKRALLRVIEDLEDSQ